METNFHNLDTRKLLSLEGQRWSHIDFGLDEDSSSNDIEDSKSDTSTSLTASTNGLNYNSFGISDTMKLKEEDMYLFGVCPAYDPFFLAVCEYCDQVIKPQALAKHIELRHRSFPPDPYHVNKRPATATTSAVAVYPTNNDHHRTEENLNNAQSSLSLPNVKGSISSRIGSNGDINRFGDNYLNNSSRSPMLVGSRSSIYSSDNRNNNTNDSSSSSGGSNSRNILLETIPPGPGPGLRGTSSSPLSFGHHPGNSTNPSSGMTVVTGHFKSASLTSRSGSTNSPFNSVPTGLGSGSSAASSPNSSSNSSQPLSGIGPGNPAAMNSRHGGSHLSNLNKADLGMGLASGTVTTGTNGAKSKSSNAALLVKKTSIRGKLLPCKDREYDPNKHCGVKIGDMDKPCTRSLTCKTHSLTLRRSVADRSKNFDDLLSEHRATKEAALRAAGIEVKPTKQQIKQRELEAKRLLQQQQQQQPKPPKQSSQPSSQAHQQKLDSSSNSSHPVKHQKQHHTSGPSNEPHLRHHTNHLQELPPSSSSSSLSSSITSTNQRSTAKETINSVQSLNPSGQGRSEKHSTSKHHHPNESKSHGTKSEIKSSATTTTTTTSTLPLASSALMSTSSSPCPPTTSTYSSNHHFQPTERTNFIEVDGCLYLPNPPKPMALCNFNARQISIEPLHRFDQDDNHTPSPAQQPPQSNLSSRLFNRKRDLTYSALTIFRTQTKTDGKGRTNNQKLLSLLNSN